MANSVDLDEEAHYEPPHQDLRCLQIQLYSSPVVKELTIISSSYIVLRIHGLGKNSVEPDDAAHYKLPCLDLYGIKTTARGSWIKQEHRMRVPTLRCSCI